MKSQINQIKERRLAGFVENIFKNFGTVLLGTILFALIFLGYFLVRGKVNERVIKYAAVTEFTIRYKDDASDKVSLDKLEDYVKDDSVRDDIMSVIDTDEAYSEFIGNLDAEYEDGVFRLSYFDDDEAYAVAVVKAIYTALSVKLMEEYDIQGTTYVDEFKPVVFKVQVRTGGFVNNLGVQSFTLLGAVIGAVFSLVAVCVFYLLDNTVKNAMEVRKYYDLPVLAVIPTVKEKEE